MGKKVVIYILLDLLCTPPERWLAKNRLFLHRFQSRNLERPFVLASNFYGFLAWTAATEIVQTYRVWFLWALNFFCVWFVRQTPKLCENFNVSRANCTESNPDQLIVAKESFVGEDANELGDIKNAVTRRNWENQCRWCLVKCREIMIFSNSRFH